MAFCHRSADSGVLDIHSHTREILGCVPRTRFRLGEHLLGVSAQGYDRRPPVIEGQGQDPFLETVPLQKSVVLLGSVCVVDLQFVLRRIRRDVDVRGTDIFPGGHGYDRIPFCDACYGGGVPAFRIRLHRDDVRIAAAPHHPFDDRGVGHACDDVFLLPYADCGLCGGQLERKVYVVVIFHGNDAVCDGKGDDSDDRDDGDAYESFQTAFSFGYRFHMPPPSADDRSDHSAQYMRGHG